MKKAIAVLGILAVVAASACGAYSLGLHKNLPDEPPAESKTRPSNQPETQPDDEPELPNFEEMLVGVWQNGPSVGSGMGDCYRFFADGSYVFEPGDYVGDPEDYRLPPSRGTWDVDGDWVVLHMTQKTVTEGGAWAEDPILGWVLEGGTEKTIETSKDIYTVYLGVFYELPREMFSIGGYTYWQLSADPDDYRD
ncbi:MAG: hypothetical protein FWC27_02120 [Firmicutes bacterium]|nr:hypothetical protein [Bacillota bacterium]